MVTSASVEQQVSAENAMPIGMRTDPSTPDEKSASAASRLAKASRKNTWRFGRRDRTTTASSATTMSEVAARR